MATSLWQGTGAGLGAQGAQDLYPKSWPGSGYAPLVGALAGGGASSTALNKALKFWGTPNETLQAYQELGLKPRMAGDITGNPVTQRTQAFAAAAPGGENAAEAWADSVNAFGNKVGHVADAISPVQTTQEAGQLLQAEGKKWLSNFEAGGKLLWQGDPAKGFTGVDQLIPGSTPVDLSPYKAVLDKLTSKSRLVSPVQPALARRLNMALMGQGGGPALTAEDMGLTANDLAGLEPSWAHGLDFNKGAPT